MPTQAPTGSMRGSLLRTAILARAPESRAAPRMLIRPWPTSGTSSLNSSIRNSGAVRLRNSCGPRGSERTSFRKALMRSCVRTGSRGIIWSRGMKPSALPPRSTKMPLRSTRLTRPDTSVPTRPLYRSTTCARSASRTFCTMTCFAVCAAMRPKATDSERHFDVAARLGVRRDVERVLEAQFLVREFEFGRVVGEHLPAAVRVVVARLAVDGDAHVDLLAVFLARSRRERCFERLEDDFLVDALLVGDGIHDHQDLFVHLGSFLRRQAPGAPSVFPQSAARAAGRPLHFDRRLARRDQPALEPAPLVDEVHHLDHHLLADVRREMPRRPQRPVDARRRHLERVVARDRVRRIEHFADRRGSPARSHRP